MDPWQGGGADRTRGSIEGFEPEQTVLQGKQETGEGVDKGIN